MSHIAIVGPIATENIAQYLDGDVSELPVGYPGAPLMATLISELLNRGYSVSAFTTSPGVSLGETNWIKASGNQFSMYYCGMRNHSFRFNKYRLGRAVDRFKLERTCIKNAILSAAPDLVHAHWSYEFGLAAIATRLPNVITCHDAPNMVLRYMPNLYRLVRYGMAKTCLKNAKNLTAVSPYLQSEIKQYTKKPITVIPNPLPDFLFNKEKRKTNDYGCFNMINIVMVSNGWNKLKNQKSALIGFYLLKKRLPNVVMHLYGTDFGPGEIADRWSKAENINNGMFFMGRTPHAILLEQLNKADVFLHASLLESCPMGIAEAMALGIPIVGGKYSGGVPWVVGDGGILTDVSSPQMIADVLYHLILNSDIRECYSTNAYLRARKLFTIKTIVDMYEEQYKTALLGF